MHDISQIAAQVIAMHQGVQNAPAADPNQVAQFERLMNADPSANSSPDPATGATMDRYVPIAESPLETVSSKTLDIGNDVSKSFRNEMRNFDAALENIDMSSPDAWLGMVQLQLHAFGTVYQVEMATGIASQANRGFQTLLHVQS